MIAVLKMMVWLCFIAILTSMAASRPFESSSKKLQRALQLYIK